VKNRKTMRFSINGKNYFIKIHTGCGWKEVIKNWVQFKQPIVSAENEYLAIRRLESLKIDTMT